MADKYPNLPGINVDIRDGNLLPPVAPNGPVVAVLGTATKGPSKTLQRTTTGTSAIATFSSSGTLARGMAEAYQGGADTVSGYRVLATKGKVEHIGDITGAAGYTVTTAAEGSAVLNDITVLYDNALDSLKVYDSETGTLVYDNSLTAPVDLGVVVVTGSKASGNLYGSVGLQVPVQTVETSQTFTVPDDTIMTSILVTAGAGLNLSLLQFDSTTNPYVIQCLNAAGTVTQERTVTAVNPATRVVTLATNLTAVSFPEVAEHSFRFVSSKTAIQASEILTNRLYITDSGGLQKLLVTPGSDFNGLPKLINDDGLTADAALTEVSPGKMNFYEAMEDAFLTLEAAQINEILVPGVYLDDPALDGETSGATALPTPIFGSATGETIEDVVCATLAGRADRASFTFDDANERTSAKTLLAAAGRGGAWIVFSERRGAAFGNNITAANLVRCARILNWEDGAGAVLYVHFDRDVSFSLSAGAVVAAQAPAFEVYDTDLLFYHKSVEVDGALVHQWYPAKTDLDGYSYNEVNFAYRMAKFCHEQTENEIVVTGVIGVNPPSNHYNAASLSTWIGILPEYDDDGDVSTNGTGLLGNKFVVGKKHGVTSVQFAPGFKATTSGELDGTEVLLDGNDYEIDMGKYLTIVGSWVSLTNDSDSVGTGYNNSAACIYGGLLAALAPWSAASTKAIGGRGIRVPTKLAKRHLNSLSGARYVMLDQTADSVVVVDAPSAALPTSDFTRNMTMRLTADVIERCRRVSRPFLGEALGAYQKAAMETALKKELAEVQKLSQGALESFELGITQTRRDRVVGSVTLSISLQVVNELRRIYMSVALTT